MLSITKRLGKKIFQNKEKQLRRHE